MSATFPGLVHDAEVGEFIHFLLPLIIANYSSELEEM